MVELWYLSDTKREGRNLGILFKIYIQVKKLGKPFDLRVRGTTGTADPVLPYPLRRTPHSSIQPSLFREHLSCLSILIYQFIEACLLGTVAVLSCVERHNPRGRTNFGRWGQLSNIPRTLSKSHCITYVAVLFTLPYQSLSNKPLCPSYAGLSPES